MTGLSVLVCGGRDFDDKLLLNNTLDQIDRKRNILKVISGGAPGADDLALEWGLRKWVSVQPFPAAWGDLSHPDALVRTRRDGTRYDARAGIRRNQKMIDQGKPDLVVAFPGGRGTADMVRRARAAGIEVMEIRRPPPRRQHDSGGSGQLPGDGGMKQ